MSDIIITALIGLAAGLIGTAGTLIAANHRAKIEHPKILADAGLAKAQTADQVSDAALALLEPYKKEVVKLRREVEELRSQIEQMHRDLIGMRNERDAITSGAYQLYHQVQSLGGSPVWHPPERRITGPLPSETARSSSAGGEG